MKEYEEMEIEVVYFIQADVVRCSTVIDGGDDGWIDPFA